MAVSFILGRTTRLEAYIAKGYNTFTSTGMLMEAKQTKCVMIQNKLVGCYIIVFSIRSSDTGTERKMNKAFMMIVRKNNLR